MIGIENESEVLAHPEFFFPLNTNKLFLLRQQIQHL